MRKLFYLGAVLTVGAALVVYWTTAYASRHPDSLVATGTALACKLGTEYNPAFRIGQALTSLGCQSSGAECASGDDEEDVSIPDEPQPLDEVLQPEETIDVIGAQQQAVEQPGASSDSQSVVTSDKPILDGSAPVISETPDGNDDCSKPMPACVEDEGDLPAAMPYAAGGNAAELQQSILNDSLKSVTPLSSATVRKLSQDLLRFLSPEERRFPRPDLDTSEFRPSDAKKAEFDHIPF